MVSTSPGQESLLSRWNANSPSHSDSDRPLPPRHRILRPPHPPHLHGRHPIIGLSRRRHKHGSGPWPNIRGDCYMLHLPLLPRLRLRLECHPLALPCRDQLPFHAHQRRRLGHSLQLVRIYPFCTSRHLASPSPREFIRYPVPLLKYSQPPQTTTNS